MAANSHQDTDETTHITCEHCGHQVRVPDGLFAAHEGTLPKTDIVIACVECSDEFVWNKGEQLYYQDRGLAAPRRCHVCRAKTRERIQRMQEQGLSAAQD